MGRDRNLLFGVLAVRLKQVTPSQLVDAAGAWATDPERDLSQRLVELGALSDADCRFIDDVVERAIQQQLPLIVVSGSGGGARMHEGILSLMQMAKISAALARYDDARGLFISVLTNPTMGGVAASFASLGDFVFAEPRALIGFAGPRTIKATLRIELPKGFQTSEFLLEHGYVDRIVPRAKIKSEIARTIAP